VDAFAEAYQLPRDQWIDLSTGINPVAFPLPDLAREYWHRLPDSGIDLWLREAAASRYGVADPAHVIPCPGSQAAIQWLPRLLPASCVAVIGPTYREHVETWSSAGSTVCEIAGPGDIPANANVVVAVNPNNPDGRTIDPNRLLAAAGDRFLIVDEAYADLTPEISLAARVGRPNLLVLRSIGKFFGLAGMRLGFALAAGPVAARLQRVLGPWSVSGPAAVVGAVALVDEGWVQSTRVRLKAAAARLDGVLVRAGLAITGGTSLFRLVETSRAGDLFEHLVRSAILVRRFHEHPAWLRIGIPADDAAFDRLGEALSAWRNAAGPGNFTTRSRLPRAQTTDRTLP
jgi:L-threonine-O-3-phosphate decarboxylase